MSRNVPFPGRTSSKAASRFGLTWIGRLLMLLGLAMSLARGPLASVKAATTITFTAEELLVRPTDTSITINIVPASTIEYHYQYGTSPGSYTWQTPNATATGGQPHNVVISSLAANTHYYYRMRYHLPGETDWVVRAEHSFWTQRAKGSTFTFTIIADSHMSGGGGNESQYVQTLANVAAENPDFHFDLGDTFWTDGVTTVAVENQRYEAQRQWMAAVGQSAPVFLTMGNHENEEGWNLDDSPSKALLNINARKLYYPQPIPDAFYSANTDTRAGIDGDGLREDYFAWEWGDALFVVIDPYQYTLVKPFAGTAGGEDNDESPIGDRWSWTLGLQQFNWFKATLAGSNAKFKFVFAHHGLGGLEDYVRGGAAAAHMFEWGGYNIDGTTWGFDTQRPGWGDQPIHQLMVAYGVSAFFHGHDHVYAYEVRDGVVYQELPSPSMSGSGFSTYYTGANGSYAVQVLPSPGHLRITVTPTQAIVDYIATSGGAVNYSYTIDANEPSSKLGGVNNDGLVNSTDALIILSADVGMDTSAFCPMNCGDVNADGFVNSTDALIILSYDVGMSVPYAVGTGACPSSVTQPAGCTP
jgi:hypothetical protein